MAKITEELTPLMDSVDFMEDMLTMEAKLEQALKSEASPRRTSRIREKPTAAMKQSLEDEADESLGEDNDEDDDNDDNSDDEGEGHESPTLGVHEEFLKHLTAKKPSSAFVDITKDLKGTTKEKKSLKTTPKSHNLDVSMVIINSILGERHTKNVCIYLKTKFKMQISFRMIIQLIVQ